jgi:rhodanese-related sulfurtransferase
LKLILLMMVICISSVFAEVTHQYPTKKLIDSKIKIIDIRTPAEWHDTGIIKDAITITFFDDRGRYNIPLFMEELQKHVTPTETFALICHTGSRTRILAEFLSQSYHMHVINLRGGMVYAEAKGIKPVQYLGNQ